MLNSCYTEEMLGKQVGEVKNITEKEEVLEISIEQPQKMCTCPHCGERTKRIHDYRYQRIKELPAFEKEVVLILRKRRYVCSCGKSFLSRTAFWHDIKE